MTQLTNNTDGNESAKLSNITQPLNNAKETEQVDLRSFRLGHLGLAAEMASEIGLVKSIDTALGVDPQEILTSGQAVLAMAINCLGFTSRALYISPQFFESTNVTMLLGKPNREDIVELLPEHLNEHKLGRTLDAIAEYGPDAFFLEVAIPAFRAMNVKVPQLHLDTSIHQFEGAYVDDAGNPLADVLGPRSDDDDCEPHKIVITRGFCKDGRPEAKQVLQELLTSSDGDVPLMLKIHSGNATDVTIMRERMQQLKSQLSQASADDLFPRVMVGDSKLYSKPSLEAAQTDGIFWVTRVPNGVPEVKFNVDQAISNEAEWRTAQQSDWNKVTTKGLKYQEFTVDKWGIEQSFIVIRTDASETRARKSVEAAVKRESVALNTSMKKLAKKEFSCEEDLAVACREMFEKARFHHLQSHVISSERRHLGRGRPKEGARATVVFTVSEYVIEKMQCKIDDAIMKQMCFVLGTNASSDEISTEEMINIYLKDQHGVENAFRFLKDPSYFTDAFFLKTPRRIAALLCIMTISLLLYSLLQRKLRMRLKELKDTVPNQKGKGTPTPTLRWVNQCFEGVDVVRYKIDDRVSFHFQRMSDMVRKVLCILGDNYVRRYSEVCLT
jgi:transposase